MSDLPNTYRYDGGGSIFTVSEVTRGLAPCTKCGEVKKRFTMSVITTGVGGDGLYSLPQLRRISAELSSFLEDQRR